MMLTLVLLLCILILFGFILGFSAALMYGAVRSLTWVLVL